MLVLTRRAGEALQIGDNIQITILSVSGDRVRIGIEAPAEISVLRAELIRDIQSANVAAAASGRGKILKSGSIRPSRLTPPADS